MRIQIGFVLLALLGQGTSLQVEVAGGFFFRRLLLFFFFLRTTELDGASDTADRRAGLLVLLVRGRAG